MSPEELEAIADALSDMPVRTEWPWEARYAVARFNAAVERERALLAAARAAGPAGGGIAAELEIALRGTAAQYREERARLRGRYDLRRPRPRRRAA